MFSKNLLSIFLLFDVLLAFAVSQPWTRARSCPPNETYTPCGPSCQTECATLNQPCLVQNVRCPDGCYCNNGFARNAAGRCIPINQCRRSG